MSNLSLVMIQHSSVAHLTSGLLSPCLHSVQAVCSVLTDATVRGIIAGDPVIKKLITCCASMPHWPVGISTVGQIMMKAALVSLEKSGSYSCPYSLRWAFYCMKWSVWLLQVFSTCLHRVSPHPFISIVNSRPESGILISDMSVQMLRHVAKDNGYDWVPLLLILYICTTSLLVLRQYCNC